MLLTIVLSTIVEFFGRFHPVLVHLPIGVLLMGLLLQLLSRNPKYGISDGVIKIVLLCGIFSALASCITGYLLSLSGEYDESLVAWHMWMGICVAIVSMLVFVKVVKKENDWVYRGLSIGLLLLITVTGHLGGSLTHGSDYLTSALSAGGSGPTTFVHKPIPNIKEAKVYGDVIQPMLQANCYSCHGPNKQKGKLRLDDSSWIFKGGKDGLVIHPSQPAESELIKRMLLPTEDEHHMPPKEKTQLKESEIALFQWWVGQGADFSKKVKDLPQPGKISTYLLALQAGNTNSGSKAPSLVPADPVDAAAEKDLDSLRARKVEVVPVAQGSHYLSANFVNATHLTEQDIARLLPLQKQLVWLKLGDQPIGDSAMAVIGQCTALTVLHLNGTRISDKGLASLQSLQHLRLLNLVGTGVTAQGVVALESLKKLQSLYLYHTKVELKDWSFLKQHFPKTALDSGGYTVPFLPWDTINEMRPKPKK